MPTEIAEIIAIVLSVFLIGSFILLLPISRRLGGALEEWVRLRRESAPDRALLEELAADVRTLRSRQESLEQRFELMAERQEFVESVVDARQQKELGPGAGAG